MQCPFCSGLPPLSEESAETPYGVVTGLWFKASDLGPSFEGAPGRDFDGVWAIALVTTFREKKKGGAVLTSHYCLTEGDTVFTLKSRVPLNNHDRDALFGFMKDSLRMTETRGRKQKASIAAIRAVLKRLPKASIRRIAMELEVDHETVRRLIKADGKTLEELRAEARRSFSA